MEFNLSLYEMDAIKTALIRYQESGTVPNYEINIVQDLGQLFDRRIREIIGMEN